MSRNNVRSASHAGSWYTDDGKTLDSQLSSWLSKVSQPAPHARAIIAPHAGYAYSGPCAAYAYRQIDPTKVKRVFILGPSHHVYLKGCALTQTSTYQTPLYDLTIDKAVTDELYKTGNFEWMTVQTDEDEHSIEMHLPYVAKVMASQKGKFTVVPVLVGSLNPEKQRLYGEIFAKYLADPNNLFVISSDFCHWGRRFSYTYYDAKDGHIYQSIEKLDRMGMDLIESLDTNGFQSYLSQYKNTICGRHPISVMLSAVDSLKASSLNGHKLEFKFHQYAQSSQCKSTSDSSVSYASGSLTFC